MIGYATIGSNDPERAYPFYDAVLAPLGGRRVFANERLQFWASRQAPGMIAVGKPFEGEASVGNGAMFGLAAPTKEVVDEVYAAAKAGVHSLTQALADELKDAGITVNAVLPSILDTPTNRADMPKADTSAWVQPADLAAVMLFLASEAAGAVTGALIPVTGRV